MISAHGTTGHPVIDISGGALAWFFLLWWFGVLGWAWGLASGAVQAAYWAVAGFLEGRRAWKLERERVRADALARELSARAVPPPAPAAGPCSHPPSQIVAVMSVKDELVAWLCRQCGTQLPKEAAVREEE